MINRRILLTVMSLVFIKSTFAKEISASSWSQVKSLQGIPTQTGMNSPSLYVFFDPNCPYCADLWNLSVNGKPFNNIPAVWIPLAYLKKNSRGKSAALLRLSSRQGLSENFDNFDHKKGVGGIKEVAATTIQNEKLDQSMLVWSKLGGATPLFVFKTRKETLEIFIGLPAAQQVATIVQSIAPSQLEIF